MNCKELGYKVGDKFEVINDKKIHFYRNGDIIKLVEDDGTNMPWFKKDGDEFKRPMRLDRLKLLEKTMDIKEAYKIMSQNCGIKVGDTVKVLRKAESAENGWGNIWNKKMDAFIGKEGIVRDGTYSGDIGVYNKDLGNWFNFPFFVLEKVKDEVEPIELDGYTVIFKDKGFIEVGCQKLDWETVKEIYERAKSTR